MRHYDHRDPEHYVKQIRAMELYECVSFLEIYGRVARVGTPTWGMRLKF